MERRNIPRIILCCRCTLPFSCFLNRRECMHRTYRFGCVCMRPSAKRSEPMSLRSPSANTSKQNRSISVRITSTVRPIIISIVSFLDISLDQRLTSPIHDLDPRVLDDCSGLLNLLLRQCAADSETNGRSDRMPFLSKWLYRFVRFFSL